MISSPSCQRTLSNLFAAVLFFAACSKMPAHERSRTVPAGPPPSILLVTLDTTRADSIGPEAKGVETPAFNALAARGKRFRQAYATVPQTLASHSSMMTGLYPAGHGVHENGRYLGAGPQLLAARLQSAGYRTAAFVSAFALARRFGLDRGFDTYDDQQNEGTAERSSAETTDHVRDYLATESSKPLFLWVHYYDPHYPYTPSEPFRSRYAAHPYLGEIAAMDQQLGRLVQLFEAKTRGAGAIIIVGDHGEGLGEHGEAQHGNLLYQATMHVPLLVIGPSIAPAVSDTPVSTRRIFHTILDLAGLETANSLRGPETEVVVGEAMKPFLDYGWQPQVMAVEGRMKTISDGAIEVYDVIADPGEVRNLAAESPPSRMTRAAIRDYPVPSLESAAAATPNPADDEARRKLASLGYVASQTKPVVRKDAPRPSVMAYLFETLDQASGLFVRGQYAESIPLLQKILAEDPVNLDAALHLAVAHASLGHEDAARQAFQKAEAIAPDSTDVRTYLGLYLSRGKDWQRAVPLLESVVAKEPDRIPALEGLALLRERQGQVAAAVHLRQAVFAKTTPAPGLLIKQGEMAMSIGETDAAIDAFSRARAAQGQGFRYNLELGVLYLSARRFAEAGDALDRVPPSYPGYPMALFKRAQVSVLLHEPDAASRIAAARNHADTTTRELIARERLFQ